MTVISPAQEAERRQQDMTELSLVIAAKIRGAIEVARRLEVIKEMKDKPKVEIEQVISAFPEHLRRFIRGATRSLQHVG